ncbi:MAG: 3'-5' exonuclease [Deltaproteobacteria bacterium]|nr:3'-5' exonuclease [Deltaproteobacteria bacterium]
MSQMSLFDVSPTKKAPEWTEFPFLVVDTETTGLDHKKNRVIEIAWVLFQKREFISGEGRLCSIEEPLPPEITRLTGINSSMLKGQPEFSEHIDDFLKACSQAKFLVAYNTKFDRAFIESEFQRVGASLPDIPWVDPCIYIREIDRYKRGKKLGQAAKRWGVQLDDAHRAMADAKATGELLVKLMPHLKVNSLDELVKLEKEWREEQDRQYEAYRERRY